LGALSLAVSRSLPAPSNQAKATILATRRLNSRILNWACNQRSPFERGRDADVVKSEGGTHATEAETGWPWQAATEPAIITFLHSLPDGSKGITLAEVAVALGRPGVDLK
jgi:hypothetical protein